MTQNPLKIKVDNRLILVLEMELYVVCRPVLVCEVWDLIHVGDREMAQEEGALPVLVLHFIFVSLQCFAR